MLVHANDVAREHLADEKRDQGVGDQNRHPHPLDGGELHPPGQSKHQQHHHAVNSQPQPIELPGGRHPVPLVPAGPQHQAHGPSGEDDQHTHEGTASALQHPAGHGQGPGDEGGERAEEEPAETHHHGPPIKDEPRTQHQRAQHGQYRSPAKEQPLQHLPQSPVFPAFPNETRDDAQGDQEGQVGGKLDQHGKQRTTPE